MCRMVGVVFRRGFPMSSLADLSEVARTGEIPGEPQPGHKDGWGMVSFRNGSPFYIGRSTRPIFMDPSFDSARKDISKVVSPNILLAHARALSKGAATIPNTHPFIMDGITLCHNGTVNDIKFRPRHAVKGETDSELLLARLADRVEDSGDLEGSIRRIITDDIRTSDYSAAIMFISDGKRLFAHRDYGPGRSAEYYDLKMAVGQQSIIFFQETRAGYEGDISQVEKGELVSVDLDLKVRREIIR